MAAGGSDDLLAGRLRRQLLSGPPATGVVDVVRRIFAVQAQDPRGFRLAIRSRSTGLHACDVEAALSDRQVVVSTLNRGTLHLVTPEDYWLLHPLTTPQLETGTWRRLGQEQVTPEAAERGVAALHKALTNDGPLSRDQLKAHIAAAGVRTDGQAFIHIVGLATIRGLVVRGPVVEGAHAFVLTRDWLGEAPKPITRDRALGEVARRYLAGHGPAGDRDLAKWTGLTLGDARRGLQQIAGSLADRDDELAALAADDDSSYELPPPRLLGPFDPSLHGWESRELITGAHAGLVTSNGLFRPFAMVNGRAVGTWTLSGSQLELKPFGPITAGTRKALDAEATAVIAWLNS